MALVPLGFGLCLWFHQAWKFYWLQCSTAVPLSCWVFPNQSFRGTFTSCALCFSLMKSDGLVAHSCYQISTTHLIGEAVSRLPFWLLCACSHCFRHFFSLVQQWHSVDCWTWLAPSCYQVSPSIAWQIALVVTNLAYVCKIPCLLFQRMLFCICSWLCLFSFGLFRRKLLPWLHAPAPKLAQ